MQRIKILNITLLLNKNLCIRVYRHKMPYYKSTSAYTYLSAETLPHCQPKHTTNHHAQTAAQKPPWH